MGLLLPLEEEERGTSPMVRWLRIHLQKKKKKIHLPMQGARVRSLVQEDPTYRGASKPMSHNF